MRCNDRAALVQTRALALPASGAAFREAVTTVGRYIEAAAQRAELAVGRVCRYAPTSTERAQRYIRSELLLSTFRWISALLK